MITHQTNQLFYNEFVYRVETKVPPSTVSPKLKSIENFLSYFSYPRLAFDPSEITDESLLYSSLVEKSSQQGIKIRQEWRTVSFYTNDHAQYEDLKLKFSPWIISVSVPPTDDCAAYLLNNRDHVLCNNLPHRKYEYRIYLKPNAPETTRKKFYDWAANYKDSIHISPTTKRWLRGDKLYIGTPFFYLTGDKFLTLVKLFLGDNVSRTQKFVRKT